MTDSPTTTPDDGTPDTKTTSSNDNEKRPSAASAISSSISNVWDKWYNALPNIHPGHTFLSVSLLSGYSAYRDYSNRLVDVPEEYANLKPNTPTTTTTTAAPPPTEPLPSTNGQQQALVEHAAETAVKDEAEALVPREVCAASANRAVRVATRGNVAVFTLLGAASCYGAGWTSFQEAAIGFPQWFGGRQHPDFAATSHMTSEQEMEYLSQKYFSSSTSSSSSNDPEQPSKGQ